MSTLTISPAFRPQLPAVRRAPASAVRLTRRGRVVVFVGALLLAFVVGVVVAAGSVATGTAGAPEPTTVVTVASGDTLWGIASELAEPGEVRAMMTRIQHLNAMDSGVLLAGQRLVVPAP
jgi:nucleoid-associated protein YgaU